MIVSGQVFPSLESTPVTVPLPSQLSVQPKLVIAGTSDGQETVISAGGVLKTGGVVSFTVIASDKSSPVFVGSF